MIAQEIAWLHTAVASALMVHGVHEHDLFTLGAAGVEALIAIAAMLGGQTRTVE